MLGANLLVLLVIAFTFLMVRWLEAAGAAREEGQRRSRSPGAEQGPADGPVTPRFRFERIAKRLQGGEVLGTTSGGTLRAKGRWKRRAVEVGLVDGGAAIRYSARVDTDLEFHVVRDPGSHVGRFVIRADAYSVGDEAERSARALNDPWVRRALASMFVEFRCDEVVLRGNWLRAKRAADELVLVSAEAIRLLTRLTQLARSLEKSQGVGEIRATAVFDMASRQCPFCRDLLAGEEALALLACKHCKTVVHAACFEELGRCAAMGCGSKRTEPVVAEAEQVRQPLSIDVSPCLVCGLTTLGCKPEHCHASVRERRLAARRRGEERRWVRQQQHAEEAGEPEGEAESGYYTERKSWRYRPKYRL